MPTAMPYSSTSLSRLSKLSGVGVGREVADAHRLAELEELAVGVVVLGEVDDAVADDLDAVRPRPSS